MAKISIKNKVNNEVSLLYEGELKNADNIRYLEINTKALTKIDHDEKGISIIRIADDAKTKLYLSLDDSFGSIETQYGTLPLEITCSSYCRNDKEIIVEYKFNDDYLLMIEF